MQLNKREEKRGMKSIISLHCDVAELGIVRQQNAEVVDLPLRNPPFLFKGS